VERNASEDEIKKAYRKHALEWHPDKHPEEAREKAQRKFADASNAYDILKDPQARQEYDMTGRVGGGGGHPGGPQGFHGGGFQRLTPEQMQQLFEQMVMMEQMQRMQQQMQQQSGPRRGGCGGGGPLGQPARRRGQLEVDQEVRIKPNVESIHRASRKSDIDSDYDERRARYAGKLGTISKVDASDQSVKVRVMVSPGRADEVWFGGGGVWDLRDLEEEMEVQLSPDEALIHAASRECGIDPENDEPRARCAGKTGTVVRIDRDDGSAKIRVIVKAGRAAEVWFGAGAFEPLEQQPMPEHSWSPGMQEQQQRGRAADMSGF